jgi:AraC-like DNA-binding protein
VLYQTFKPSPRLAPYVRFFWALEDDVSPGSEFIHRSTADGCVEMVFHYRATFDDIDADGIATSSPLSNIQAQSTLVRRFSTRESFGIFGAYLYPYAIPRLFAAPATDFTNISPDLESVFGRDGKRLEDEVIVATDNLERVGIVTRFLDRKLSTSARDLPPLYRAINSIIEAEGDVRVAALAREHQLSTRQFERKFKEFAGLNPKLYPRVVRFQAATQLKLAGIRDLTEIAYACGYYDQSHFINDFRQFSGYTPKEYFWTPAEGTQYMNAVSSF